MLFLESMHAVLFLYMTQVLAIATVPNLPLVPHPPSLSLPHPHPLTSFYRNITLPPTLQRITQLPTLALMRLRIAHPETTRRLAALSHRLRALEFLAAFAVSL